MLRDDLKPYKIVLEVLAIFDAAPVGYPQGHGGYGGRSGQPVVPHCLTHVLHHSAVHSARYNPRPWSQNRDTIDVNMCVYQPERILYY